MITTMVLKISNSITFALEMHFKNSTRENIKVKPVRGLNLRPIASYAEKYQL